ncbi:hypothetical protein VULLAG_LOCUS6565 [Vulpes lagopus]
MNHMVMEEAIGSKGRRLVLPLGIGETLGSRTHLLEPDCLELKFILPPAIENCCSMDGYRNAERIPEEHMASIPIHTPVCY